MQQRDEARARQFTDLVSAHQTALLRLCHTLLRDRSLAEDAVQDTFLRVWQHIDQLREVSNPRAWLYRIAVNRCRDLRRSAWFRHIAGQIPESQPDPSAAAAPTRIPAASASVSSMQTIFFIEYFPPDFITDLKKRIRKDREPSFADFPPPFRVWKFRARVPPAVLFSQLFIRIFQLTGV